MSTATLGSWTGRDTLGVYVREAAFQFRTLLRTPGFALPTLLLPPMFYTFFALLNGAHSGPIATHMLATFSVFGVMAPGLFGFGVGVATERERGILALKRVAPMPPLAYLFAKAAMAMLFALIIVLSMFSLGALLGGIVLPAAEWGLLALTLVVGTVPFCALGLAVGLRAGGQSAAALINVIYLPMAFLSGLWAPLRLFPHWLRDVAALLPAYHLSRIALGIVHAAGPGGTALELMPHGLRLAGHLAYLLVFTALCLGSAQRAWRRIEDR